MNNKLEELMYQSGLTASGCWDSMDDYDHKAIEKLCELIVRDCIDTLHQRGWTDAGSDMQEYFGVKK